MGYGCPSMAVINVINTIIRTLQIPDLGELGPSNAVHSLAVLYMGLPATL
jgi:hypothetical protein